MEILMIFTIDYGAIAVDDILNIQKYLMKKRRINKVWIYFKNVCYSDVFSCNVLKYFNE